MQFHVSLPEFLNRRQRFPVFDVRTPAEFSKGHIPDAINLPLFSNEERHEIGLMYKNEGKKPAILHGLDLVGPRMRAIVETVQSQTMERSVLVHCWRGGMRSDAVAWLLSFAGFSSYRLDGGYKAWRKFILHSFSNQRPLVILGGRTGAGKSLVLRELGKQHEPIIDLEALAHHKGSAFGDIDQPDQPTQEQFDNNLGDDWLKLDGQKRIWLEDESHFTGSIQIPEDLWKQMRQAQVIYLDVPVQIRAENLVQEYGQTNPANLERSILKIREKLGGADTKTALHLLETGAWMDLAMMLLKRYYDPGYDYGLNRRNPASIQRLLVTDRQYAKIAEVVKEMI